MSNKGKRGARTSLAERIIDKLDMNETIQVAEYAGIKDTFFFAKAALYRDKDKLSVKAAILKLCKEKLS